MFHFLLKLFSSYAHCLLLTVHYCLHSSKCSRSLEAKKRRNRIKKEKRKQKELRDFNQENESLLQMESQVITLQKKNRLLKRLYVSPGNTSVVELVVNRISVLLCRCVKTNQMI